jgi:hypothetical protein
MPYLPEKTTPYPFPLLFRTPSAMRTTGATILLAGNATQEVFQEQQHYSSCGAAVKEN